MHSVRSRRRKPYKRPRQQQPEQAPDASGAHMPVKAATPAPNQAPNPEGSQMPQHAHKRARAEPRQAPESSTGGEILQEALAPKALRLVQNFTAIGTQTPPKASTPTARGISRDMTSATAPLDVTATVRQTQTPQLVQLQQPIPLSSPGLGPILLSRMLDALSAPQQSWCLHSLQTMFCLHHANPTVLLLCSRDRSAGMSRQGVYTSLPTESRQ